MREYVIDSRNSGMRLSRFVEKTAPSLPVSGLYKAIRTKRIKLNGKKCHPDDRLAEGDVIQLWLDESSFEKKSLPDFMRASADLGVLYEDADTAVLYKPQGLSSHPYAGEYSDNLVARFLRHLYENGEYDPDAGGSAPALCNRLDRNTEGIVLAGKNHEAVKAMNALIKDGSIRKTYLAVTVSRPPRDGIYEAWLLKDEKKNTVRVRSDEKEGWQKIITEFRTLSEKNGLWLAECILHTGRTHQIRAHLSFLGAPILGDGKYGDRDANRRYGAGRQMLAAYSVQIPENDSPVLAGISGKTFRLKDMPFRDMFG
ncbi:MAG: RluA family pseudouridine synthase [Oscillospiraceae bacterium]|nr:RluA family pseudouridine synthase [Oscillospiraceae bacterium]